MELDRWIGAASVVKQMQQESRNGGFSSHRVEYECGPWVEYPSCIISHTKTRFYLS